MRNIYTCFFILSISSLIAGTNLDQQMSLQEKQQTGVVNLTLKQRKALSEWIDCNYNPKQSEPIAESKTKDQLYISIISMNGKQLILSDNTRWLVYPQDVPTASLWIAAATIQIVASPDPEYPFIMKNLSTQQSIRVQKMAPAPSSPNPTPYTPSSP